MEPARYGPFKYTPITRRPKLSWPNGERVAVVLILNVEAFHLNTTIPTDSRDRPSAPPEIPMVREWVQREYGNRVGIFRIMEVLNRHGFKGTVALNSDVCDTHPEVIEDMVALDWEFIGHGKTNTEFLYQIPADEEHQYVKEVLDRIERAAGRRPVGWLGPGLSVTWNTVDHLATEGCIYVADWSCDDQPFLMRAGETSVVSVPCIYDIDDSPIYRHRALSPTEFERIMRDQFDVLYEEGEQSGRLMGINLHPFLTGQAHRIRAFDRVIEHICSHEGVWKATGGEIARHFLSTGLDF